MNTPDPVHSGQCSLLLIWGQVQKNSSGNKEVLAKISPRPLEICITQTDFYHRDSSNTTGTVSSSLDVTLKAPSGTFCVASAEHSMNMAFLWCQKGK